MVIRNNIFTFGLLFWICVLVDTGWSATETCTIRIGGGGKTRTYSVPLKKGGAKAYASVKKSDFIRSTKGPCTFTVFNSKNFKGHSVTLGTNLTGKIRAGLDGVQRRKKGGGKTWRIRSLKIHRPSDITCKIRIGGNGRTMTYYVGSYAIIPAMNRIREFSGRDCRGQIWSTSKFGAHDDNNRFKPLHPTNRNGNYDPGYNVRSMKVINNGAVCAKKTRDNRGRCLPQTVLPRSIYVDRRYEADHDFDGLDDALENMLAHAFRPIYMNHSSENATRANVYTSAKGKSVTEPVTLFQVQPTGKSGELVIRYMKLWLWDKYNTVICGGHKGDSQRHKIYLRSNDGKIGKSWRVRATSGGVDGALRWTQNTGSIRKVNFGRIGHGTGKIAQHLEIYFSKGKHHEYPDGGRSGQADADPKCTGIKAYLNGRGKGHMKRRTAIVHSPKGKGDRHNFNNVGSRWYPFFNDLAAFGFSRECVWRCHKFYTSSPACHGFDDRTQNKCQISKGAIDRMKAWRQPWLGGKADPVPLNSARPLGRRIAGHWGLWARRMSRCPKGMLAVGFRQRVEPKQGKKDDSALNGIQLKCRKKSGGATKVISSRSGPWGRWSSWRNCAPGHYLSAFDLKVERKQGKKGDDSAANDTRFRCTNGKTLTANRRGTWGRWQAGQTCRRSHAISGFRTRVEGRQHKGDDTAMNGLEIVCGPTAK